MWERDRCRPNCNVGETDVGLTVMWETDVAAAVAEAEAAAAEIAVAVAAAAAVVAEAAAAANLQSDPFATSPCILPPVSKLHALTSPVLRRVSPAADERNMK